MFAYCNNNPVNHSDPSGCLPYENNIVGTQAEMEGGYGLYTGFVYFPGRPWSDLTFEFSDSVYDSADYYPDLPTCVKLLSADISILSFEMDKATIISARGSLLEVDIESDFITASLYDIGVAEISLGADNSTLYATAMVTAWNPNIDLDFGFFTLNLGANIGSYGVEFSVGKDGISWGVSALFGYSVSINF